MNHPNVERKTRSVSGILHFMTPDQMAAEIVRLDAQMLSAVRSERESCLAELEQGIWFGMTTEQVLQSIADAISRRPLLSKSSEEQA